ncbi:universal stress protein [Nibrella viscosa]|uniref:Universal stress protein n=1 Tax=Nibrella viscosa TaxID=1084524 RepID=A0ABP8L3R1_9BACT
MKTIVLATDFSKNSSHAGDFALQIAARRGDARRGDARLILLHVYRSWAGHTYAPGTMIAIPEFEKEQAERKLSDLMSQLQNAAKGRVDISILAAEGLTKDVINEVAADQKADLLIMGTAGSHSDGVRYFGSLATDMIPDIRVPMLLVPPKATFTSFKNIALAVDLTEAIDAVALDNAIRFANLFNACLNVVCVTKAPEQPTIQRAAERIRDLLKHQPHTFSIIQGDNLPLLLMNFAEENRADLIMMMPKPHSWWHRLLTEGNTQQVARQSDIPVLAVI